MRVSKTEKVEGTKRAWVSWITLGLIVEKILQHGLTGLFFSVNVAGIGTPDIGNRIVLSNPVMATLNFVLMMLFIWGFRDVWHDEMRGLYLILVICSFDIVAEFTFHGFTFITVSVLVAATLIVFVAHSLISKLHKGSNPRSQHDKLGQSQ